MAPTSAESAAAAAAAALAAGNDPVEAAFNVMQAAGENMSACVAAMDAARALTAAPLV